MNFNGCEMKKEDFDKNYRVLRYSSALLNKLRLIIAWGKYDFPKKPSDYRKLMDFDSGGEGIGGIALSNDEITSCDELYNTLKSIYRSYLAIVPFDRDLFVQEWLKSHSQNNNVI